MHSSEPAVAQPVAHPPETLEGWYALHQTFSILPGETPPHIEEPSALASDAEDGWTRVVRLIGSKSDYLVMHFRSSLDGIGDAQARWSAQPAMRQLRLDYSFLSVTEAGLYHVTAKLAREAVERGGSVGDETYTRTLAERAAAERESAHVRRRLYPSIPEGMSYVCFYPMSKRRETGQNWYSLTLDERSRLMYAHGLTGRRYAGRVMQVISGAIGLDAWEWGVTLFAHDPLDFKRLVTEMRFDEASARYAEFGDFYVGKLV